jgi:hypothetical protein
MVGLGEWKHGGAPLVVIAAFLNLALVGCSASSSAPVPNPTPTKASGTSSGSSRRPAASSSRPSSSGQLIASPLKLACQDFIGHEPPPTNLEQVLGVVALPTSSKAAALQTSRSPGADSAVGLFAKTGLIIRAGTRFELVVPDGVMVTIGWGKGPVKPSRRVTVSCPAGASSSGWLAYPGGYWLPRPTCALLIVRANGKERRVHIGLGTPCPGQLSPQGPSDQ